jgi:hypothetical protein
MKTELTDVSETRKTLTFEIPQDVVDAEINRIAKTYSQKARIPGFRPGKVPATIVKQRFRDQIMHDVMHGLIPRAVDDALQERGIEPVDTPSIKDVALHEGQPMTFTATIDTVPSFDPGDLSTITLRPAVTAVAEEAVDKALDRLRDRSAKYEAGGGWRHRDRRHRASQCRQRGWSRGRRGEGPSRERAARHRRTGEPAGVRRRVDRSFGRRAEDVHDHVPRGVSGRGNGRTDRDV